VVHTVFFVTAMFGRVAQVSASLISIKSAHTPEHDLAATQLLCNLLWLPLGVTAPLLTSILCCPCCSAVFPRIYTNR
jgi:hypothetical protein